MAEIRSVRHLPAEGASTAHGAAGMPWRALLVVGDGDRAVQAEAVALEAFGIDRREALGHALAWANLDLEARRQHLSLPGLLARSLGRDATEPTVAVSALLFGNDLPALAASARNAAEAGHRTFKLKVGNPGDARRPEDAVVGETTARVSAVREVLPAQARLRLDANQAWTCAQLRAITAALAPFRDSIDWLEDPCLPEVPWQAVLDAGTLPLAPDERCREPGAILPWLGHARMAAVVLKPSLWGPERSLGIAAEAHRHGLPVIASSAYEGEAGLALVAAFAAAAGSPGIPHGLVLGTRSAGPVLQVPRGLPEATGC